MAAFKRDPGTQTVWPRWKVSDERATPKSVFCLLNTALWGSAFSFDGDGSGANTYPFGKPRNSRTYNSDAIARAFAKRSHRPGRAAFGARGWSAKTSGSGSRSGGQGHLRETRRRDLGRYY